ncbi:MAG: hypothetical protein ACOCRK_06145 [bacterium]
MKTIKELLKEDFFTKVDGEISMYLHEMAFSLVRSLDTRLSYEPTEVSYRGKVFSTPLSSEAYDLYLEIIGEINLDSGYFSDIFQDILRIIFIGPFGAADPFNDIGRWENTNLGLFMRLAHLHLKFYHGVSFTIQELHILSDIPEEEIANKLSNCDEDSISSDRAMSFLKKYRSDIY